MKRAIYLLIPTMALVGCASLLSLSEPPKPPTATEAPLPDGSQGYDIACADITQCHQKAEELCAPAGYQVYERIIVHETHETRSDDDLFGSSTGTSYTLPNQYGLLINCR